MSICAAGGGTGTTNKVSSGGRIPIASASSSSSSWIQAIGKGQTVLLLYSCPFDLRKVVERSAQCIEVKW